MQHPLICTSTKDKTITYKREVGNFYFLVDKEVTWIYCTLEIKPFFGLTETSQWLTNRWVDRWTHNSSMRHIYSHSWKEKEKEKRKIGRERKEKGLHTLPPLGVCFRLSMEPHFDWTWLKSSFSFKISTYNKIQLQKKKTLYVPHLDRCAMSPYIHLH